VVHTTSAEVPVFSSFRTFAFRIPDAPAPPYSVSTRTFQLARRVHDLIEADLLRRGYVANETNPDIVFRLTTGIAQVDRPQPTTTSGGNENNPQSMIAGEIIIDAFDGSTSEPIWHGASRAAVDPLWDNEAAIESTVERMMARFPTRAEESGTSGVHRD
jgi:hypothetical protein